MSAINDALVKIASVSVDTHPDQRIVSWRDTLDELYQAGIMAGRVDAHIDQMAMQAIAPLVTVNPNKARNPEAL